MRKKGRYVWLSLVSLMLGFMIAYSYSVTAKKEQHERTDREWDREYKLREKLIDQEEANAVLQRKVAMLQRSIREEEAKLGEQEKNLAEAVQEVEQLRVYIGTVKTRGQGLDITLSDSTKAIFDKNVNNYLVHDGHIQAVLHELYAAGAEAIAINGQRLTAHSYVTCVGPVINVDGTEHPAPFVITAVGNPDVMQKALNIRGGVVDRLLGDNISVKLQTKNDIELEPYYKK